jgi:antitoxin CcdA
MARKSLQDPPRVSVDAELLKIAKEIGVNISKAAEDALRKAKEPARIRRWREENKEAIESYNAHIERDGIFGEELLEFEDDPPSALDYLFSGV